MKNKIVKWILGVISAIFVSAIGSGLWTHFLGGVTSKTSKILLTIATLGLNTLQDQVYLNIARGFHELPSLMILLFLLCTPPLFVLSYILGKLGRQKMLKDIKNNIRDIEQIKDEMKKRVKKAKTILVFLLFIYILMSFFQIFIINYENRAVTYFYQSLSICKPFIEPKNEDIFLSKFAQIKSKKDYIELISELNDIAESNNTKLPTFNIW